MSRYVISLGGNALGNDAEEQKELLKSVAVPITELIKEGHEIVLVHGNGPQVGMINLAFTESPTTPDMPFPECGAMSQGYIGFHLQNALYNVIEKEGVKRQVASIVTQVLVDENDQGFQNPTKPIGAFYTKEEAEKLQNEKLYVMKEDSGRGYRRVVPSPMPIDVIEKDMILSLVKDNHIVICAGGGGIPVIRKNHQLQGVAAVIDKDFASAKVAELIDADYLIILTAVDYVYLNFNKPNQIRLETLSLDEIEPYLHSEEFGKGSMYPKVKASYNFVKNSGNTAVISSLDKAEEAFKVKTGTILNLKK